VVFKPSSVKTMGFPQAYFLYNANGNYNTNNNNFFFYFPPHVYAQSMFGLFSVYIIKYKVLFSYKRMLISYF